MKLKYIVPISHTIYIGDNVSLDGRINSEIEEFKIDDFLLEENKIEELNFLEEIDYFSKDDNREIRSSHWVFSFECEEEKVDNYKQKLNLLLLACRIIKYSDLSIKYLICKNAPDESSKYSDYWKYAIAEKNPKRDIQELNKDDLEKIVDGYYKLKELFKVSPRTTHAINFLILAYTSYYWMEAYIIFMTSLETLVSPPTEVQITSNIIKRTRKLVNDSKICSKKDIDELYKLRSDIIHGRILVSLDFNERIDDLIKLQIIVLKAFENILESDFKTNYKDENSKEKFFELICNNE